MVRSRLCLLLVAATAVACATPAFATPINWLLNPSGQMVAFNIVDFTMAKTYLPQALPFGPVEGVAAINAVPDTGAPPGAQVITMPQVGLGGIGASLVGEIEDGWTVVEVKEIVGDPNSTLTYWSEAADPNTEIVGLVYGLTDVYLEVDATGTQTTGSAGLFIDLYAQPKGSFDPTIGSVGRTAFDKYTGIGYDAAGVAIPGAELLLHLESTDGKVIVGSTLASDVDGDGDSDTQQIATFDPQPFPIGSGEGESHLFLDALGGKWADGVAGNLEFEAPDFYFPLTDPRFGVSQYADLHGDQNLDPASLGPADWVITSEDPTRGRVGVVPEPLTMLAVGLALSGLGFYTRRRTA